MVARQKAHDFAALGIHADVGAKRIHHIDALGLAEFPRAGSKGVGLADQRADGAKINDIARQVAVDQRAEIGRDLCILAPARLAHDVLACDFGGEAHAAGAGDAAGHMGLDQRAQIKVFGRPLRLAVAREIDAVGHRLILKITLTALIADRAIQRVVDEQELHHPFAGLFDHGRVGFHDRRLALRTGAQVAHLHGAGGGGLGRPADDFHKTHPAVTGDRQTLVVTEARHLDANLLAGLNERHRPFDFDFFTVDDDLADIAHKLTLPSVTNRSGSIFESLRVQAHNSFAGPKYRPPWP